MVINWVMQLLRTMVTAIIGLIPAYTLPSTVTSSGATVGHALSAMNGVFPVVTLGICIGLVIAVRLFIVGWGVVLFIYNKFPGKAT